MRRLRKRLLELPAPPHERGTIGSEEAAKLRSLGYLTGSNELKTTYGPADDPKTLIKVDQTIHIFTGLMQEQKFDEAVAVSRRVVAENPHMKLGYQNLSSALVAKKDVPGAIRVMEQATANGAGGETMDRRRGLLLSEIGRPAEAVKVLMQYQESEDPESLNALGIVLTDAGRPAEALPIFARAIELDPVRSRRLPEHGDRAAEAEPARRGARQPRDGAAFRQAPCPGLERARRRLPAARRRREGDPRLGGVHRAQPRAVRRALQHRPRGRPERDWKKARAALEKFVATAPPKQYGKDIAEIRAVLADMKRQGV